MIVWSAKMLVPNSNMQCIIIEWRAEGDGRREKVLDPGIYRSFICLSCPSKQKLLVKTTTSNTQSNELAPTSKLIPELARASTLIKELALSMTKHRYATYSTHLYLTVCQNAQSWGKQHNNLAQHHHEIWHWIVLGYRSHPISRRHL